MTQSNDTRSMNTMQAALFSAGLVDESGNATMFETEEQETARLVARVKDAKLPGYGTAQRWKLETLRKKVAELDATDTDDTAASETVTADETTTAEEPVVTVAVAETVAADETDDDDTVAEAVVDTPAETPVVEAPAENPNFLKEAEGFVLKQRICVKIVHKLPHALLGQPENGPTMQLYKKELAGGTHHNRKVRYDELKVGDEVMVEVTKIRPPKEDDARKRFRFDVSERVIQDESVCDGIVCGTATQKGTEVTGVVVQVHKDYARVRVEGGVAAGFNALLHATEVNLPSRSERDAYIAGLSVGDTVTAEAIEVKTPKNQDILIGLSLAVSGSRDILSLAGSDDQPGAEVKCTVKSKKDFGAFVTIDEGPAAGRFGLIHVSQMPGRYPNDRDEYLASVQVGQQFTAEVTKAAAKDDGRIEIGLSLTAGEYRARKASYKTLADDTESTFMATVFKSVGDGVLVEFRTSYGEFKGKLPSTECPASLKRGDNTRVKVANVEGSRITLHRRGL